MQVDSRSGGYIFSQSRRAYWVAELLPLRIRERRETFGLSCAVSAICRARPARGSECTRSAYFCAKRATASISRGKPLQKSINREKSLQKYSCFSFAALAAWREKYPATVVPLSQSRMDFSRRAAEFIEPQSYCFWELEHAERPSVLWWVHRDELTVKIFSSQPPLRIDSFRAKGRSGEKNASTERVYKYLSISSLYNSCH